MQWSGFAVVIEWGACTKTSIVRGRRPHGLLPAPAHTASTSDDGPLCSIISMWMSSNNGLSAKPRRPGLPAVRAAAHGDGCESRRCSSSRMILFAVPQQRNGSQQQQWGGLRARVTAHLPDLAADGIAEGSPQNAVSGAEDR